MSKKLFRQSDLKTGHIHSRIIRFTLALKVQSDMQLKGGNCGSQMLQICKRYWSLMKAGGLAFQNDQYLQLHSLMVLVVHKDLTRNLCSLSGKTDTISVPR